jgi:excisionase family DNA binding protein
MVATKEVTERKYVRPADVVQQTRLSKSTVMAALWSGELEAYRKGRSWLIPVEAIDRWIRGGDEKVA